MAFFKPATRHRLRLRMAIDGPSGSGKTFTALRFGHALAKPNGRIAVINTESGAAEKYLGLAPDGEPWRFDIGYLADFSPTTYAAAILAAGREGYDVLIVDSLSHAWAGEGGALELKDKRGGNSYTAWKDVTPMHQRMVEAILRSPCHVIVTMRSKVEHILEEQVDDKGRRTQVPRKVGMAPIQRPGMEYEFDLYGQMDWTHTFSVSKTRCPDVDGLIVVKPNAQTIEPVIRWLNEGTEAPAGFYTASEEDIRKSLEAREAAERETAKAAGQASSSTRSRKTAKEAMAEAAAKSAATQSAGAGTVEPAPEKTKSAANLADESGSNPKPPAPASDCSKDPPFDPDPDKPGSITSDQAARLAKYFDQLEVPPDKRAAALKKRGANAIRNLSKAAAEELIGKLMAMQLGFDQVEVPPAAAAATGKN